MGNPLSSCLSVSRCVALVVPVGEVVEGARLVPPVQVPAVVVEEEVVAEEVVVEEVVVEEVVVEEVVAGGC